MKRNKQLINKIIMTVNRKFEFFLSKLARIISLIIKQAIQDGVFVKKWDNHDQ